MDSSNSERGSQVSIHGRSFINPEMHGEFEGQLVGLHLVSLLPATDAARGLAIAL